MTTHSAKDAITFECDGCDDETLKVATDDWSEANDRRKAEGWSAEKVDGQWMHLCPHCRR